MLDDFSRWQEKILNDKNSQRNILSSRACEHGLNIANGIFVDGKMVPKTWKKTASLPKFPSSSLMNQGDQHQLETSNCLHVSPTTWLWALPGAAGQE